MIYVQMDVEDEILSNRIPKFSLQPIVENCFIHGLEGKMETWSIRIRAEKVLGEIEISIADNGIGIGEEKLAEIRRQLSMETEDKEPGESIGLSNVNARIKLLFGDEYGLFVTSEKGEGTTVKLVIPDIEETREGETA